MLPYVAKPPRSANALAVIIAHVGFGQSKNFWGTSTTSILAGILQGETEKKNHNLCSRYTVSLSPIKIQHLTLCPVIKKRSKSKSKLFQNKNQCFGCCLGHLLLLTKQTWIFVYYCYFDSPFKFNSMGFSYMLSEATLANFSAFIAHLGL